MGRQSRFFAVFAFSSISLTAFAGSGHIDKVLDIEVNSISPDGLSEISIRGTVISAEELRLSDGAREYVISVFGEKARAWPIMTDINTSTAFYLNKQTNRLVKVPSQKRRE